MTKSWFAIALLAVACGGDKDETTDTTTDTTVDTTDPVPTTPPTTFEVDPEADLTDIDVVAKLSMLSAVQQIYHYALIMDTLDQITDGACPVLDYTDPADVAITGGCTDAAGLEWTGTLRYQGTASGITLVMTDGFGIAGYDYSCSYGSTGRRTQSLDGTLTVDYTSSTVGMDLVGTETALDLFTCTGQDHAYALEYTLQITDAGYGSVYSGSGRYTDPVLGRVDAQTLSQVNAYNCDAEVDSGVTLLSTSTHDVAIVYDGAVNCNAPGASTWTLDGVEQGTILVGCSTAPSAGWLALLPLGLLARRRR
jgi:hypothetical protein